jgi:hypothetical protein
MNNLSAIHHDRFNTLHELTGNYNKATLLDKLIYWWQISTYTLNDNNIWFTRSIAEISESSKIPKRTVERYLSEFAELGYIEKVNRLLKIKHLYIRITEKTLSTISGPSQEKKSVMINNQKIPVIVSDHKVLTGPLTNPEQERPFLNHNGVTDTAIMAELLYKDKDNNLLNNSTISDSHIVNNLNSTPKNPLKTPASETPTQNDSYTTPLAIEKQIGERLELQLKNYIKGTLRNLQEQHGLHFSNPDRIFAEVVFSVLNPKDQLAGIQNNHHRVNIIAKLMREKRWTTPKGFYNHWDVGTLFKKRQKTKEINYESEKQQEMQNVLYVTEDGEVVFNRSKTAYKPKSDYSENKEVRAKQKRLQEIESDITSEMRCLNENKKYYGHDEHPIISSIMSTLEKCYTERAVIRASLAELKAA